MTMDPLLITILLEGAALLLLGERRPLLFLYWTSITTLTNLPANIYVSYFFSGSKTELYLAVAVIEAIVFLAEFLLCFAYTKDKKMSAKYSAVCNLASFCIGSLMLMIF